MTHSLLHRIQLDRYDESQLSHGGDPVIEPIKRHWFNKGSQHAEALIQQWINGERLHVALEELRDAEAVRSQVEIDRDDRVRRFADALVDEVE